ncbi:MAG: AMP-binding protein, partial [Actinobacteria bacterium]|nr:AMP-binding protein [Actinomycetota bacterium]
MSEPVWTPDPRAVAASPMQRFIEAHGFESYEQLHAWSVNEPEAFWGRLWDAMGIVGERGDRTLERGDTMRSTRFFPDALLNVAENILWGDGASDDQPMILETDERGGPVRSITRGEARAAVAQIAAALRADGVERGDVVAAWMPNTAATMLAMLGATAIGATFTSTSSDFGVDGVLDRFQQVAPKVLIAADGYSYGGKRVDCLERLEQIRAGLPTLRRTIVVSVLGVEAPEELTPWADWLAPHEGAAPHFEALPFDHPWYV